MTSTFKQCGFHYDRRKHLLFCRGGLTDSFGLTYLGADADAGPNYSGQEAVNSYYRKS